MDLSPFKRINPCGYPGLEVTQLAQQGVDLTVAEALEKFLPCLLCRFLFNEVDLPDDRIRISNPRLVNRECSSFGFDQ